MGEPTDLQNHFELLLCLVQLSGENPILFLYLLRDEIEPFRVDKSVVGD